MSKRIVVAIAVLAFSAGAAFANPSPGNAAATLQPTLNGTNVFAQELKGQVRGQGRMGQRRMPTVDERVARMKKDLNLTDEQADRVKELLEHQQREARGWRNDHPQATRAEMREHREHMYKQMNEGLKKILTKRQYKKHEEMMRRMRRGRMGPPRG